MHLQPVLKKERPLKVREVKPPKPRDIRTECCVCLDLGDNTNLVRSVRPSTTQDKNALRKKRVTVKNLSIFIKLW